MLVLKNVSIESDDKEIIKNINLEIKLGKLHVLMGPNGSGKSSLAYSLMGHYSYNITSGQIFFKDQDITNLAPEKRAKLGLFLACQYPQEVPGVEIFNFLRESYHILNNTTISVLSFESLLSSIFQQVGLNLDFMYRSLNQGFSGGEKKRLEIAQLLLFKPDFAVLDEIDSGVDVDALKIISQAINSLRKENPNFSILLITHYMSILKYLEPDLVHILSNGKLVKSGDIKLAEYIEQKGYSEILL